jgi:hypothetical protein
VSTKELARLLERQQRHIWLLAGGAALLLGVAVWTWLSRERAARVPEPPVASAVREVAASASSQAAAAPSSSVAKETEDAETVLPSEALPLEQAPERGRGKARKPVTGGRAAPTPVASFPPASGPAQPPRASPKTPIVRHAPF